MLREREGVGEVALNHEGYPRVLLFKVSMKNGLIAAACVHLPLLPIPKRSCERPFPSAVGMQSGL